MSARLQDRVAVITGGNSGIGLATAREFKANGAKLVIFGRNRQTLDEAAAALGNGALAVQGDVRKLADIDRLFDEAGKKFGKVDVLVANAGIAKFAPVHSLPESLSDELCDYPLQGRFFHSSGGIAVSPRRSLGHSGECLRRGQTGASWHIDLHGCKGGRAVSGALSFRRTSAAAHPRERNQPRHDRYADHYA